jgi:hypothetical protein
MDNRDVQTMDVDERLARAMLADITHLRELIYSAFDADGSFIGTSRETRREFAKVVEYLIEKKLVNEEGEE